MQRQVHKADVPERDKKSPEQFLGSEVDSQKKGKEAEMPCIAWEVQDFRMGL